MMTLSFPLPAQKVEDVVQGRRPVAAVLGAGRVADLEGLHRVLVLAWQAGLREGKWAAATRERPQLT